MNMRTPLKNARRLGSAKEGADHFWMQRVTAVANLFLGLFLVWLISIGLGASSTYNAIVDRCRINTDTYSCTNARTDLRGRRGQPRLLPGMPMPTRAEARVNSTFD